MKSIATLLAGLLVAGVACASDVYVTMDAQGNPIYTDTPQSIPAAKVDVHTGNQQPAAAPQRIAPTAKPPSPAGAQTPAKPTADQQPPPQSTAEDKAKRCTDARTRYQGLMENYRIYEQGPNGERTYLTSEQIDAARASAKQVMDQFCADQ